jgi:hypothetical protein
VVWRLGRRVTLDAYAREDDNLTERPFDGLAGRGVLCSAEFQNGRHAQVSTDYPTRRAMVWRACASRELGPK